MTHELASGDFIILEICDKNEACTNPVNKFREFCGPADPCMAHALRPHTLRADFGINKVLAGLAFVIPQLQTPKTYAVRPHSRLQCVLCG